MNYDKEITIEVLKDGDTYTIGSMTLHETLTLDELDLILNFSIERAKTMNELCLKLVNVKYPDTKTPVYSITIILTEGIPNILIGSDGMPLNRTIYDSVIKRYELSDDDVEKLENACHSLTKSGVRYWGQLKTEYTTQIIGFPKGSIQITYYHE